METKISIPSPCSEDWNKMTPTKKGAYCDKCAFEVIDFTEQTPEEIRATLKSRIGSKTCAHISKTQLEMVNTNFHVWENQPVSIFRSKFLYACLMVFGFSLFTGCGSSAADEEEKVGMVEEFEVGDVEYIEEDTTVQCDDDLIDGMMDVEVE
ncbi:MAG: hypothetical protein HUJ25_05245 [Crocinitomicaceae bacterium]|nr:hypothetical protein [Crocinitomicaceae bacterium]